MTLAWIVGVPTEETCDEREVRSGAVGEVSETVDSCRVRGGGWWFGLILVACREYRGVVGSGTRVARFHVEPFENFCSECMLADGDGGGCAVHFPSQEVTNGAKIFDSVAGGELFAGVVE